MSSTFDFHLHGSSLNIVKQCGPGLSDIIQSKFGCVATFDGVDFGRSQTTALQRRPIIVPQKRLEVTLGKGITLSVWKADLTTFKADAVVNAANKGLQHGGGLAEALCSAGGPKIQKESDDYITRKGHLETGDAVVLTAGSLKYNKIIHAVGPHISKSANSYEVKQAESLLHKTIKSILHKVKEHRFQSVAIPAISSGLFNFPLPLCADTIVKTVKNYYEVFYYGDHRPQEIFLVNNDEPSVKEMERACREIFKSYSRAAASPSKGAAASATSPRLTVQIGNVHLTLKKGKIEDQQTDVIVNTISPNKDLKIGQISYALLEKAGPNLQKEICSVKQTGHIFITSPHKLQCKAVYHTFCLDKDVHAAQQILFNSVHDCLLRAAAHQHNSIAFPAIGTGGLRFNKKEAARIMSDAVIRFASDPTNRMDVCFVIYPYDNDTYKAFEEQMRALQSQFKAPDASISHASGREGDFRDRKAPIPQITLNASDEALCEATGWLRNHLYNPSDIFLISNNFILYFGEHEHRQLADLKRRGVSIVESFDNGRASIIVKGDSVEDVAVAGLQVEAILCKVQKDFVAEEEGIMRSYTLSDEKVSAQRKPVDSNSSEFLDKSSAFRKRGIQVVKVEKVENFTLTMLFELKKKQLSYPTPRKMFQRIPVHFCDMVTNIGFHTEYAPPDDPKYGEGIYFADSVKASIEVWKNGREEEGYLYFVEAEVLTGKDTSGQRGLILPPLRGKDPLTRYDSVNGGHDISVIFSGYQARPRYIITCHRAATSV